MEVGCYDSLRQKVRRASRAARTGCDQQTCRVIVRQASESFRWGILVMSQAHDTDLLGFSRSCGGFLGIFSVGFCMLEIVKRGRETAVHVELAVDGVKVSLDRIL